MNVIKLLIEQILIELTEKKPKVLNGLFAIPKKDRQRLIVDARRSNLYFSECLPVVLPNLGDMVTVAKGTLISITTEYEYLIG